MLAAIGLDEVDERVYRLLVTLGAVEADDLARRLGTTGTSVELTLRSLEQRGLIARAASHSGGRWVAAPPGVALRALLNHQRHELEQAEVAVARLAAAYRADATASELHDLVEVIVGAEAVSQRFLQIQLGAVREVAALVTSNPIAVSGGDNEAEETAATRGVEYRIVLERDALEGPDMLHALTEGMGRDEKVRIADRVPTKLIIADRESAMVPLLADGSEPAALLLRASGLVESLVALFESVWESASPLRIVPDHGVVVEEQLGPDEIDVRILSLLLAGLTDASIAKSLDLGLRTVQRRVRGLMDLAGVTTRMQLGWHARERGWLTRA